MNKKLLVASMLLTFGSQNFVEAKKSTKTTMTHLDGTTALIEAVKTSHKSNFKKTLKYTDVNVVDKSGKTAMDYAAEQNNKKFMLELSKKHALVTTDKNRITVKNTVQHKVNAYKGAGITWILVGPAAVVGGASFLARRASWKTIAAFYNDPKAPLA